MNLDYVCVIRPNGSRGFAFVAMGRQEEADAAQAQFNGKKLDDRALTVNEAKLRDDRPQRSFRGDRGGKCQSAPAGPNFPN